MVFKEQEVFCVPQNPLRYFLPPATAGGIFLTDVRKMAIEQPARKHKGGRPRKAVKRESKLGFNATPVERLVIQEKAKRSGLRIADYLRDIAMQGKVRPKPSPEELKLHRDLTGAANNLNQLVKEAHKQNLAVMVPKILRTLEEVTKTLKNIRDAHQY